MAMVITWPTTASQRNCINSCMFLRSVVRSTWNSGSEARAGRRGRVTAAIVPQPVNQSFNGVLCAAGDWRLSQRTMSQAANSTISARPYQVRA
ncbi:hypothetical protein D3C78_1450930 [compost metagenome]